MLCQGGEGVVGERNGQSSACANRMISRRHTVASSSSSSFYHFGCGFCCASCYAVLMIIEETRLPGLQSLRDHNTQRVSPWRSQYWVGGHPPKILIHWSSSAGWLAAVKRSCVWWEIDTWPNMTDIHDAIYVPMDRTGKIFISGRCDTTMTTRLKRYKLGSPVTVIFSRTETSVD